MPLFSIAAKSTRPLIFAYRMLLYLIALACVACVLIGAANETCRRRPFLDIQQDFDAKTPAK